MYLSRVELPFGISSLIWTNRKADELTLYIPIMKHRTFIAPLLVVASLTSHGELVINEIMQSNIDCVMDDLNEFPDSWVELYNSGSETVELSGYKIGVKSEKKAYRLPSRRISPGTYVTVWCDKSATGLHTDFRLESGKDGAVYLYKDGVAIDKLEGLSKQPAPNVAYGRVTDGAAEWGYQARPTPGSANTGEICRDILPAPVFSISGGVVTDAFTLDITVPDGAPEGTVVRYTVDGKEPTRSSRGGGIGLRIDKTTTVRAVLVCDGYLSPRSTTQSYIFSSRDMTLPVISMVTDPDYFYDSTIGIYVAGKDQNHPNYKKDWRRPVNFELFMKPGEEAVLNQLCETRVKGGASRDNPLKSLVVYANKRFGTKRLDYEFFPDDAPGLTDWKSIDLRNAGNDFDYLYFRDALIQRVMGRHTDLDWQPWQPAVFMVNGEYKGILNIRPRSNEDHIYTFYDGLEDIDMFENWWELKEGTRDNLDAFTAFYTEEGHTIDEYERVMDTGEFANLMIMNIIFNNRDFPGNNIVMWRPTAEGGRWRWIAKDTDFGLGLYYKTPEFNTLEWLYTPGYDPDADWANKEEHTRLFRRLMDVPEFRDDFIDRCAVYMGDFLSARAVNAEIDEMHKVIKSEYTYHRALFNPWWPNYGEELSYAKRWMEQRVPYFYGAISDFFKLGKSIPLKIDLDRTDDIRLAINGIELCGRGFDGQFFAGRRLSVTGESSDPSLEVVGWQVKVIDESGEHITEYSGPELSIDLPLCREIIVNSKLGESGIDNLKADSLDQSRPIDLYDLSGRFLGQYVSVADIDVKPGIYVVRQGSNGFKHIVRQ